MNSQAVTEAENPVDQLQQAEEQVAGWRAAVAAEGAQHHGRLAVALNDLATLRNEAGDTAGALAAIDESVALWDELAAADPAEQARLALALNNQATLHSVVGDGPGARAAIDRAVALRRALAAGGDPVARTDLAVSLNNLAGVRYGSGDPVGALVAMDEAVALRRGLVEVDRAEHLPELADVLVNRCTLCLENGDADGALAAAEEAVEVYRQALHEDEQDDRADLRRRLAPALDRLAQLREQSDPDGAVEAIDAAVVGYTELAADEPARYLPELAVVLNNQASMHEAAGRHQSAREALETTTALHRDLARFDPVRFAAELALVTRNLVTLLGPAEDAAEVWTASVEAVRLPQGRAQVRAGQAAWLLDAGRVTEAAEALAVAAAEADEPEPDAPQSAFAAARQQVRAVATQLDRAPEGLPGWAVDPVPQQHLALVDAWSQAQGADALESVLRGHATLLTDPELARSLGVLLALQASTGPVHLLGHVVSMVAADGLEATIAELVAGHRRHDTIEGWFGAGEGAAAAAYLEEHRDVLAHPTVMRLLEAMDDPRARPRLAVLHLDQQLGATATAELLDDPATAAEHGLTAVDAADLTLLSKVVTANQHVVEVPGTGPFLLAVLLLGTGKPEEAMSFGRAAAAASTAEQRAARRENLTRLAAALAEAGVERPDGPSPLDDLTALFADA